jgi:O-antigen ligase
MHTPAGFDFTGGRIPIWRAALARWAEKPWLGTGYRTTPTLQGMDGFEAHNVYLSVLVEMGVLGAAVFAALLFMILRAAPRMGPERLLLALAVAILAGQLTSSSLFGWGGQTALLEWLMLFALAASGRTQGAGRSGPGVGPETP